jgi:hypothetical protein
MSVHLFSIEINMKHNRTPVRAAIDNEVQHSPEVEKGIQKEEKTRAKEIIHSESSVEEWVTSAISGAPCKRGLEPTGTGGSRWMDNMMCAIPQGVNAMPHIYSRGIISPMD